MSNMREKTCCFTGHRVLPAAQRAEIAQRLEQIILHLLSQGITYFGAGGALGFDTLAAQTVLRLREDHPQLRLILVLPCRDQTRSWREANRQIYNAILAQADKVVYTSEEYTRGCMFRRNRRLVDGSSVCVSYCTKSTGGTVYTVNYAKKQGLTIYNLAEPQ